VYYNARSVMPTTCNKFLNLFIGDQNEQEALDVSQESYNYQGGWRKLRRASVKYIHSHVHGDPKDQINLDNSARRHSAAGNGSLVLPVILHVDTSSNGDISDFFQLCCKVYSHVFDEQIVQRTYRGFC